MTVGAAVLHWIQPSGAPSDTRYEIQLLAREVKHVVQRDAAAASVRWRGIRVHAVSEDAPAVFRPHFHITALGKLVITDRWRNPQSSDNTDLIEIAVEASGLRDDRLPPRQLDTLLLLLREMRRNYVVADDANVRLDERCFASSRPNERKLARQLEDAFRSAGL